MCDAVSFGTSIIQGALGFTNNVVQQRQAIEQQRYYAAIKNAEWEIAKKQADDEARMRKAAGRINLQQLDHRQLEINDAATEQKTEIALAAERAKASAALLAGEAGTAGNSVQRLLNSIESEATRRTSNVEASRENAISAAQMDKLATIQGTKTSPIYRTVPDAGGGKVNYLTAGLSGLTMAAPYLDFDSMFSFGSRKKSETSSTTVSRTNKRYYVS